MPAPSTALSTLRPDLAGSFQEFDLEMDAKGFVAQRVLPPLDVAKPSGTFGKIKIASLLAQRDTLRAPGSSYARQRYEFEKDSYATEEHGAEDPVDDKEAEMYGDYLNAEQTATARARDVVMRNYEQRVATLLQTTGSFTNAAAATAWSTIATAVPLTDIETRVQSIWNATGIKPNAIVIPYVAFRNFRNCAQVVDRIKYSGLHNPAAGNITLDAIAALLDIPNVIVAGAKKNGANEGQTASLSNVWTATVVGLGVIATNNDVKQPCVGRTFHYSADGSQMGGVVETYREEQTRSDVVRVRQDTDEKLLYSACWQLITGC